MCPYTLDQWLKSAKTQFHTAMSEPGKAPKPGPKKVEAGKLREHLGIRDVNYVESDHSLAVVHSTIG